MTTQPPHRSCLRVKNKRNPAAISSFPSNKHPAPNPQPHRSIFPNGRTRFKAAFDFARFWRQIVRQSPRLCSVRGPLKQRIDTYKVDVILYVSYWKWKWVGTVSALLSYLTFGTGFCRGLRMLRIYTAATAKTAKAFRKYYPEYFKNGRCYTLLLFGYILRVDTSNK